MNFTSKWRDTLQQAFGYYHAHRLPFPKLFPRLFLFFIFINVACYWIAIATAFPECIQYAFPYYFKIQFPVGILGALFDSLSFFITIYIIGEAIKSSTALKFISHLSTDFIIAVAATFWVLFVFSFSSWLVRLTEGDPVMSAELVERQEVYKERLENAIQQPAQNKRNIYFGLVMGISAMLPTCFHLYLAFRASLKKVPGVLEFLEKTVIYCLKKLLTKP